MKSTRRHCSIIPLISFGVLSLLGVLRAAPAQTPAPKPQPAGSVTSQPSAAPVVPAKLQEIEANAEGIFDVAPKDDWTAISKHTSAIAKAWEAYRSQAATDRVPQKFQDALAAALKRLEQAETAKDKMGALRASNQLMFAAFDIFETYRPAIPADIGRLDARGQQLIINLIGNDLTAAGESLAQTKVIWARLKPAVLARQGADAAAKYEASLQVQTEALAAKDGPRLKAGAQQGLDLVDVMEKLF
ncbi:MAG: hypothetical protein M3128_13575 [Verrucomicrobiota bacterium]|nr:hypothetical protein [Verrucomicrobiota bacterium]